MKDPSHAIFPCKKKPKKVPIMFCYFDTAPHFLSNKVTFVILSSGL